MVVTSALAAACGDAAPRDGDVPRDPVQVLGGRHFVEADPDLDLAAVQRLVRALAHADVDALGPLLDASPRRVDLRIDHGRTAWYPLHDAVRRDLRDVVAVLLERGADVDVRDGEGATPLHHVRSAAVARMLLEAGASPRARTSERETVLRRVARRAWTEPEQGAARLLVEAGARLDLVTAVELGWADEVDALLALGPRATPRVDLLYAAVRRGSERIVTSLARAGVDLDARPGSAGHKASGFEPPLLEFAVQRGRHDIAAALLDRGATGGGRERLAVSDGWPTVRGAQVFRGLGGDVLDRALRDGHAPLARALLVRGLAPDAVAGLGHTYDFSELGEGRLARCAWMGRRDLVELLLDAGAHIDAAPNGASAVLAAAAAGHRALAEWLFERGARLSLHSAAALGRVADLRALAAAEPGTLQACDARCGFTPLAWAVFAGEAEAVEALLDLGADPRVPIGWPHGLIDPATSSERFVLPRGNPARYPASIVDLALARGRGELAERLLAAGAPPPLRKEPPTAASEPAPDPGPRDPELTPWEECIEHGVDDVTLLEAHLARGADPNHRVRGGETALHTTGDPECVRRLLAAGADVDARDDRGDTPLLRRCSDGIHGAWNARTISLLLDHGADPFAIGRHEARAIALVRGEVRYPFQLARFRAMFAGHVPEEQLAVGGLW